MYVYGITPAADDFVPESAGLDEGGEDVFIVTHDGLSAVVSYTSRPSYHKLDRQEAVQYLLGHQRVVEELMAHFTTLPLKFGTVVADESRVGQLLKQGNPIFRVLLDRLAGCVQMEIVVLWNIDEVFREIAGEQAVVQLKAAINGRPERDTVTERIALGQLVQASLEQRRKTLQDAILAPLNTLAEDLVINGLMDDRMVLNVGLLLKTCQLDELGHLLETADRQFAGKLTLRSIGPLPPYSFATIEVRIPCFAEIEAARQCLCLDEWCAEADIKKAYYRRAAELHPDHNPGDANAEGLMAHLTQAYQLLCGYAQSWARKAAEKPENGGRVDFRPAAVADTILIDILRPNVQT